MINREKKIAWCLTSQNKNKTKLSKTHNIGKVMVTVKDIKLLGRVLTNNLKCNKNTKWENKYMHELSFFKKLQL